MRVPLSAGLEPPRGRSYVDTVDDIKPALPIIRNNYTYNSHSFRVLRVMQDSKHPQQRWGWGISALGWGSACSRVVFRALEFGVVGRV